MQSVAVPLTNGGVTLIDECDLPRVMKHNWYRRLHYNMFYAAETKSKILLHRFIMKAKKGQMIDHANRNGLDNRKCNLRFCTITQNNANMYLRKDNTSGYKGVSKDKRRKKCWFAQVQFKGKNYFKGMFHSIIDAAFAYDKMAVELFGEFARLNFPNEIDSAAAIEKIKNSHGRILKVAFTKRSDGSERIMLCRVGVNKGLTGKGLSYNPEKHNVFIVYDMIKRCYRMIPLENLKALWMDKQKYKVA